MGFFSDIVNIVTAGSQRDSAQQVTRGLLEGIDKAAGRYDQYLGELPGVTEQSRALFQPYYDRGMSAYDALVSRLGLNGGPSTLESMYSDYLNQDFSSPIAQQILKQQEESVLRNAAATGGLRSGNTQAALAQFAPQLAERLLNNRMTFDENINNRLGGLAQTGFNSASSIGNLLLNMSDRRGNALSQLADLDKLRAQAATDGEAAIAAISQGARNSFGRGLDSKSDQFQQLFQLLK